MKRSLGCLLAVWVVCGVGLSLGWAQATRPAGQEPSREAKGLDSKINMDQVKELLDKAATANTSGNEADTTRYLSELTAIARRAGDMQQYDVYESINLQILKVKGDYLNALFDLAELYRRTNPIWATDYYSRYLRIDPSEVKAYYGRGSCYLARDLYTSAIEDLKHVVNDLDPMHVGGLVNLALALRGRANELKGDPDLYKQALEYMKRGVQAAKEGKDPETHAKVPELQYRLGVMTWEYDQILARAATGKEVFNDGVEALEQALTLARDAADAHPEDVQALAQVIQCYDALSKVYDAMAEKDPKDPAPLLRLADLTTAKAAIQLKTTQLIAIGYYKKATQIDPKAAEYWFLLAKAYQQVGQTASALTAADKAVNLAPDRPDYKKLRSQLTPASQPATQPKKPENTP